VAEVCDEDPAFSAADPVEKLRQHPPWSQQFGARTLVEAALAGALVEPPMSMCSAAGASRSIAEASICMPPI